MAQTSINISAANLGSGGSGSSMSEGHNFREKWYTSEQHRREESGEAVYYVRDELSDTNEVWRNPDYYAGNPHALEKLYERDKAEARDLLGFVPSTKKRTRVNKKTGREYEVEGWTPIREAVVVCKPDTGIQDFGQLVKHFRTLGIGVVSIAIHRDEGHFDAESGEFKCNNHAHLVLDYLNHATGRTVKLTDEQVRQLQDETAKSLGMERGTPKPDRRHLRSLEFKAKKLTEQISELAEKIAKDSEKLDRIQNQSSLKAIQWLNNYAKLKSHGKDDEYCLKVLLGMKPEWRYDKDWNLYYSRDEWKTWRKLDFNPVKKARKIPEKKPTPKLKL